MAFYLVLGIMVTLAGCVLIRQYLDDVFGDDDAR